MFLSVIVTRELLAQHDFSSFIHCITSALNNDNLNAINNINIRHPFASMKLFFSFKNGERKIQSNSNVNKTKIKIIIQVK